MGKAVTSTNGLKYNGKHWVPRDLTKAEMVMGHGTCHGVYPDCNYQPSL